jgi:hypothetical protein
MASSSERSEGKWIVIDGLKLTMTGEEVIELLDRAIARREERIRCARAEMDGKVELPQTPYVQLPAEMVEDEIFEHRHRIAMLTMIREHIVPLEVYLLGRRDLRFGEMWPVRQYAKSMLDAANLQWVTRPIDCD